MPIFDYECKHCGKIYEELVLSSSIPDSDIECPECGEHQSVRRMSAPSISTGRVSSLSGGASCESGGFT